MAAMVGAQAAKRQPITKTGIGHDLAGAGGRVLAT